MQNSKFCHFSDGSNLFFKYLENYYSYKNGPKFVLKEILGAIKKKYFEKNFQKMIYLENFEILQIVKIKVL